MIYLWVFHLGIWQNVCVCTVFESIETDDDDVHFM